MIAIAADDIIQHLAHVVLRQQEQQRAFEVNAHGVAGRLNACLALRGTPPADYDEWLPPVSVAGLAGRAANFPAFDWST